MTSAGVAGMMFQCVFEGSLSMRDSEIERRPYHKNCSCAPHRSEGDVCSNACQRNISFPKKQSWSDGSLCMQATASSRFSSPLVDNMSTSTGNRGSVNGVHNSALSHRQ
ncbi:hypothetical protein Pyn_40598 [Prunus yedoensis var. nudiflora]|uniref:Uncharacterized protein n=1 Tax=Prunus yedoensis var. nudiflora TaxID=2094558 RepID=A0A314YLY6_PRUYE|nr:hypothetical protein Pyn_40598 [Prunus yedoensis var. nudiflora]